MVFLNITKFTSITTILLNIEKASRYDYNKKIIKFSGCQL